MPPKLLQNDDFVNKTFVCCCFVIFSSNFQNQKNGIAICVRRLSFVVLPRECHFKLKWHNYYLNSLYYFFTTKPKNIFSRHTEHLSCSQRATNSCDDRFCIISSEILNILLKIIRVEMSSVLLLFVSIWPNETIYFPSHRWHKTNRKTFLNKKKTPDCACIYGSVIINLIIFTMTK